MKIVITAGGTSESIDMVRKITNSSTGKLGATIANVLLNRKDVTKIFYICTKKSIKPPVGVLITSNQKDKLEIIEIESTLELKDAVENVLMNNKIDYFIHSMAVSDYMVSYVSTSELLTEELKNSNDINYTIKNAKKTLDNSKKISSTEDNLIIMLKQTPKIINIIKKISPNTHLFGFKLLEDVSEDYLIEIAKKLRDKNDCDYVIANDLKYIRNGNHKAFIIDKKDNITEVNGKDNIANMISEKIRSE
jgi:phosphopantothenate---cysteine ligase (CTP)